MLLLWMIAIVCSKPTDTKEKKTSSSTKKNKTSSSTKEKKPSTSTSTKETKSTRTKEKKPKRIGFLTALALSSGIGPELALNYGPKAYKAMKKRYESGKAHLRVMGKDGKIRDAKDGEAVRVDLTKLETYAIIDKKGKEAIVAHPNLLAYDPPDSKDGKGSTVIVEHMAPRWNQGVQQWDQNGYGYTATTYDHQQTQQPYTTYGYAQDQMGNTYTDTYTENTYYPQGIYTQEGAYGTYEEHGTYTDLPEHTPYYPEQGPPKNEIPRSTTITEITLWPGFWEKLPDGSLMEAYHIPYAFAPDSTFSLNDVNKIRMAMDKFAQMTCVRFTPTWYEGQHHIVFNNKKGEGCCSYAGVVTDYGNQSFNLEDWCMEESIIIHELMHAAGLHHTQQRADRDRYVNVHWDYIGDTYKTAYQRFTNYQPPVPYDIRSVMHYMSNQNEEFSSMTDHTNHPEFNDSLRMYPNPVRGSELSFEFTRQVLSIDTLLTANEC
ncbi:astacin (Peptidase family m12A) domain-containing protein [Ditylenchus destructor]|uniref:Metalloendopeptidase n=1 Tax=Ditylenchus destructor TaxID=166010 RepID=A0AAD4QZR6_9BILA|nr:astacin (Peptidase family m12A) domain-containing protein [Ditylenchus destructor]